jgi:thiamine-phosphate pyrophosphorylase
VEYLRQRLDQARLYLVCDERSDQFLEAALRGGVDIVQLRMKEAPDQAVLSAAARYRRLCDGHGALFIINDRPDLAVRCGADGVHLGQNDVPIEQARNAVGGDRLIGLSTHTAAQLDGARDVDYIGVGPVYSTPTKPGREAVGVELVEYAARRSQVPFFAIGGINPGNVAAVCAVGANRVAVVRALTDSNDPEAAGRALRSAVLRREVAVGSP